MRQGTGLRHFFRPTTLSSRAALLCLGLLLSAFDFSQHSIPVDEILDGGPPKDGIPALHKPKFETASEAVFLDPTDRVLGIVHNGEAKAYPIAILNWHELVNDSVGGKEVLISYCPLCGTGMAFEAVIDDKHHIFGVSGKLYNSDVLFYDKETESLWSQIRMEAVTGPQTGTRLKLLPLRHTTWRAWKKENPDSLVLSTDTGYFREYDRDPYRGYDSNPAIMFPISHDDSRLPRKGWVLGVIVEGLAKAYPFETFQRETTPIEDVIGDKKIYVHFDLWNRSAWVVDTAGQEIPSVQAYWFAWAAFHPNTDIHLS